ncbi:MAG: hypothetical protein OEY14_00170 [Myxococcales bacterium]|nr:hypothetical protein [Myxococcales bacterium]
MVRLVLPASTPAEPPEGLARTSPAPEDERPRAARLGKLQLGLGLGSLAILLLAPLGELRWLARGGAMEAMRRAAEPSAQSWRTLLGALLAALLLAHAWLGRRLRRQRSAGASAPASIDGSRLHRLSGALAGGSLVALAAGLLWAEARYEGVAPVYAALRVWLGQPLPLGIAIVGLTALSLHAGEGLAIGGRRLGLARSCSARRALGAITFGLALVLWVLSIQTLGHFSAGRPLFWQSTGAMAPPESTPPR